LVISFSVRVAGVLLVFVFLVAPAIMAFIITDRLKPQLLIGWTMGTLVTVLGLFISYSADLPSGPTVVSFYGIVLVVGALVVFVIRSANKAGALKWIGVGAGVAAAAGLAVYGFGSWLSTTEMAQSEEHQHVAAEIVKETSDASQAKIGEQTKAGNKIITWLRNAKIGKAVSQDILAAYAKCDEDDARLTLIKSELHKGSPCAYPLLAYFLACEETGEFFRSEGLDLLKEETGRDFGYNPEKDAAKNLAAIQSLIAATCKLEE
jgi:hypothetical protein